MLSSFPKSSQVWVDFKTWQLSVVSFMPGPLSPSPSLSSLKLNVFHGCKNGNPLFCNIIILQIFKIGGEEVTEFPPFNPRSIFFSRKSADLQEQNNSTRSTNANFSPNGSLVVFLSHLNWKLVFNAVPNFLFKYSKNLSLLICFQSRFFLTQLNF